MESALARHRPGWTLPRSPKLLSLLSDERLVHEVRAGNSAAFEAIYDRHHRPLLSFCRHLLGSQAEAEDALQQTFVNAYASLVSPGASIRLRPWLFTIARNRCMSMLRRRPVSELKDEPSVAGLDQQVRDRSDLRELLVDMQRLPGDQRAALILSELGDLSHPEIADVLGCPAEKVKSLVFQARSHLIAYRAARDASCEEIRQEIAAVRRGAPSRRVRDHVAACAGCDEFRAAVQHQGRALKLLLPVVPAATLRMKALAAAGGGTSATAGAIGGGLGALSQAGAVKLAALAAAGAAGVAAIGTGFVDDPRPSGAQPHRAQQEQPTALVALPARARVHRSLARHTRAPAAHARQRRAPAAVGSTPRATRPPSHPSVHRGPRVQPPRPHSAQPGPPPPAPDRVPPASASPVAQEPPQPSPPAGGRHGDRGRDWAITRGQGNKYGLLDH